MSTRIYRACDACEVEGVDVPGSEVGPFDGRMVDLCPDHITALVTPLMDLVGDRGHAVDGKPPHRRPRKAPQAAEHAAPVSADPGMVACLLCDHVGTIGGMGGHLRRIHDATIGEVYGPVCPVCGKTAAGTHVGRAHPELGGGGMVAAVEWARTNGDPFGVYADLIGVRPAS